MCDKLIEDNDYYIYGIINDIAIRVSVENWRDIWSWRDCKTKPSYWFKLKLCFHIQPNGYENYTVCLDSKSYLLSRVLFKLYNPEWNLSDSSSNNLIDHINKDSLDNRIENLRIVTQQQNSFNTNARGTSQTHNGKWMARLTVNYKNYRGKSRETEAEAHEEYLILKAKYHILPP